MRIYLGVPDYFSPLELGKEWLFELTCKHQPRTGAILMNGGELFVRATGDSMPLEDGVRPMGFLLAMGLEIKGKVVVIKRGRWGGNPSDPRYAETARMHGESRQLSVPPSISEAYYHRFDGMIIPKYCTIGIGGRMLPYPTISWQVWETYLERFRGYKKKYLPWLEERIPGIRHPGKLTPWINFRMFLYAPGTAGKEGDAFFVKNHIQDGVIYHVHDGDVENMRILADPAEAIDRYCEHVLLEKEGRFDFMPYTQEWRP
ncbi:hypothetical protein OSJ77_17050 [Phyllobacterium sp. 0TCS1.6C]|nr:hypothetical protein [Phyllobacterium sp. 0TCS1.6C]MCX8281902.1 hypothetical protein [Phyllobacterium sp. 0TCS1.6C]